MYEDNELLDGFRSSFKYCDHPDSDGFTFSIKVSGASGGNCWGDYATPFRTDREERIDDIKDEILSGVRDYFDRLGITVSGDILNEKAYSLAQNLVDSSYDSHNDYEYYGNYTDYEKYFVSIAEVLDFAENTISSEEKEKILSIAKQAQKEVLEVKDKENKYNYLKETEKKINNFKNSSSQEEKQLISQLKRAKKDVEIITKKLANLEKTQSKDLQNLEKTKKELTEFLGSDYISSKEKVKKKNGY